MGDKLKQQGGLKKINTVLDSQSKMYLTSSNDQGTN
jgi:hypothetical protein